MPAESLLHNRWIRSLLDFVFPPLCLGCGQFEDGDPPLCRSCRDAIDAYDSPLCLECFKALGESDRCPDCGVDGVPLFAYGNYVPPLREIIIQMKFRGITLPASFLADWLAGAFGDRLRCRPGAVLVPIPLHPGRENRRGYNQAALLADHLGGCLDLTVNHDVLYRSKNTRPQATMRLADRARNVRNVFGAAAVEGDDRAVILVDDVVTSGSTMRAAASEMRKLGWQVVAAVSAAHGL
jgi:ComF family protein